MPLAEIAFDHTGKRMSDIGRTSRQPASITRPMTPRARSAVNVPVVCAGVNVEPGDVVVADDDGVVVIPKKLAIETAQKAQKRKDDEDGKRKQLEAGTLSLDMYKMREPLAKAGLVYVDRPEDA